MHSTFQHAFDTLEVQRKELLESLSGFTTEQMNHAPADKWSIAQILSHIISAERLSAFYIRKKMLGAAAISDSGTLEAFKFLLLQLSQRLPGLKFKAPKKVVEKTELFGDLATITWEWNATRNDLREVLEKIPEAHAKRKIFKHVRVGYLDVKQGILFLREHVIHHAPQIKKLIRLYQKN